MWDWESSQKTWERGKKKRKVHANNRQGEVMRKKETKGKKGEQK